MRTFLHFDFFFIINIADIAGKVLVIVIVIIVSLFIRSKPIRISFNCLGAYGILGLPVGYAFATCLIKGEEAANLDETLHHKSNMNRRPSCRSLILRFDPFIWIEPPFSSN